MSSRLQGPTDIVDGQVLFSQSDDFLPDGIVGLDAGPWIIDKELSLRVIPKLMGQLVKAARCVAESLGDFGGGQSLDEIGPQGFVLPMGGVLRREKDLGQIHLANSYLKKGASTSSDPYYLETPMSMILENLHISSRKRRVPAHA